MVDEVKQEISDETIAAEKSLFDEVKTNTEGDEKQQKTIELMMFDLSRLRAEFDAVSEAFGAMTKSHVELRRRVLGPE